MKKKSRHRFRHKKNKRNKYKGSKWFNLLSKPKQIVNEEDLSIFINSGKPSVWKEIEDNKEYLEDDNTIDIYNWLFTKDIRYVTTNLATSGWYDKEHKDFVYLEVWNDINDDGLDKYGTRINFDFIKAKILEGNKLLDKGYKVCVRCAAGMNRSNSIACAILTFRDKSDTPINDKWKYYKHLIEDRVDRAWLSPILGIVCQEAIKELVDVNYTSHLTKSYLYYRTNNAFIREYEYTINKEKQKTIEEY